MTLSEQLMFAKIVEVLSDNQKNEMMNNILKDMKEVYKEKDFNNNHELKEIYNILGEFGGIISEVS
jgi:BioD-like phosphotransacetylase family protein